MNEIENICLRALRISDYVGKAVCASAGARVCMLIFVQYYCACLCVRVN